MIVPPPAAPDADTPQVLLFGHTGAGKSSLLGALVRAGETQGETLRGEVQESSGRLASIRDAVYRGKELQKADTELTSYTVRLRPWRVGTQPVTEPVTVVLHDCSGKAAESLIRHPSSLHESDTRAPVARAVIETDAIMLLVDATSDDEELQEAFEEFDTFLTVVAQGKANAREVGGFPIFLVLTKCDELAVPGDTRAQWEARVEQRAERAWRKFDAFLKDADPGDGVPSPFLPFGSVDLSVYAVAIRLPKLKDAPADPETPFRVAELFRDCFAAAGTHHNRVKASNRRLIWTVRAALALVSVMFLGALAVALFPPQRSTPGLAERVEGYRTHEPEAAVRLADVNIVRNKQILFDFRTDPGFISLPDDLREFVTSRLKEIEDYETYRANLVAATSPGSTRNLADLEEVRVALETGKLALPTVAWAETPAGQLRRKWLDDVKAIREAEQLFLDRYRDFVRRGTVLTLSPTFGGSWRGDVNALIGEAARPPAPLDQPVPGSYSIPMARGQAVTNHVPFEFERVYDARREWEHARDRLGHLRDLADALGLTAGPELPSPVLVLPEPRAGVDSASLPEARWTSLLRTFPHVPADFHVWELANFPDPGRTVLAEQLDRSFRTGARHVHALIGSKLGVDLEAKLSRQARLAAADGLGDPVFQNWDRLLHLLLRLRNPAAPNPVGQLVAFLRADQFDLDLRDFDLEIPPGLSLEKVTPAGSLAITVTPENGQPVTKKFKPDQGTGDRKRYTFTAEDKAKLAYRPGDELRAELPVKVGTQDFALVWESGGPRTYQFDRLAREPRLVKVGGASEPAPGVKLIPGKTSTLPTLPALFPEGKK